MLDWFTAAALASVLFSVVTVLDKRLVAHLFPSFAAFNVAFGLIQFYRAGLLFLLAWATTGLAGDGLMWAVGSGLLWAVGLSLFFYGLSLEEVSRASPIQAITPVFTVAFAVVLFGESMSGAQWAGMAVVVTGAFLISVKPEDGRIRLASGRALVVLVASAFFLAWGFIFTDEAADRMGASGAEAYRTLLIGIGVMALTWRPRHNRDLLTGLRTRRTLLVFLVTEGALAPVAMLTFAYALSVGPVARASVVFASWPLIVLVLSTALSTRYWNVLNEPLDRQTLGLKAAATLLIVAGVVLIRL